LQDPNAAVKAEVSEAVLKKVKPLAEFSGTAVFATFVQNNDGLSVFYEHSIQ
jgi:hypothetical protein